MGDQSLARPGLPVDQHMPIGLPQIENILAQALHHRGLADQLFHQLAAVGQFTPQRAVVHDQPPRVGGFLGQLAHPVGVEGLFEEIERAHPHRLNRHRHIAMAGDHDDRQGRVATHQLFQKLHPVHARHLDVGNDDARVIRPQCLERVLGAAESFRVIARKGQPLADRLPHVLFVIYNRDFHCLSHAFTPPLLSSFHLPIWAAAFQIQRHRSVRCAPSASRRGR